VSLVSSSGSGVTGSLWIDSPVSRTGAAVHAAPAERGGISRYCVNKADGKTEIARTSPIADKVTGQQVTEMIFPSYMIRLMFIPELSGTVARADGVLLEYGNAKSPTHLYLQVLMSKIRSYYYLPLASSVS
jgi:hypothetical protein